ncbi:MAG: hypothetical protein ACUVRA_03420 [Candidatus Bathyarchaeaceae archaeon]
MKKKLIVGISVTMFLVTMMTAALPTRVSAQFVGTIEVGIVGPKGWIQWDGLWEGAQIARDLINDAGGILGPDGRYEVVLVDIDEHAVPTPDPAAAIAELLAKLTAHPNMLNLFGGFRSECVMPMEEKFLDHCAKEAAAGRMPPIWTICGAATDEIISPVKNNYDRYKYMFRATPMNSTVLFQSFLFGIIKQVVAPKLAQLYYGDPTAKLPTYIIAENLIWCDKMVTGIETYGSAAGLLIVGKSRPSAVATDFSTDIAAAEAANAKLVIHIFSAVAGANFIKQYGLVKPKFACIGINVESQMQEFYVNVEGGCEYETFLATVPTQEGVPPLNPYAKPLTSTQFWAEYKARFGHCPIYTAWGSYDGIIALNETSYDPPDSGKPSAGKGWMVHRIHNNITGMITHTETFGVSDGFAWKRVLGYDGTYYRSGAVSLFKYTGPDGKYHDVFSGADALGPVWQTKTTRAWIVQWQAGKMMAVFPQDQEFSRKWMIPPWMYSLETDFAGGPSVPTAIPGYNYLTPDRTVYLAELAALRAVWFLTPPFNLLEADMAPQDHLIGIYDASRVGKDWGKSGTPA